MIKLDLKEAYFLIPVTPDHQNFLSFQWGERKFHFICLPFGLLTAPLTFTNVTTFLKNQGVPMVVYLDLLHQESEKLRKIRNIALYLLENLGEQKIITVASSAHYIPGRQHRLFLSAFPRRKSRQQYRKLRNSFRFSRFQQDSLHDRDILIHYPTPSSTSLQGTKTQSPQRRRLFSSHQDC